MASREEEYPRRMKALGYEPSLAGMDDDDIEWELSKMEEAERRREAPPQPLRTVYRPVDPGLKARLLRQMGQPYDASAIDPRESFYIGGWDNGEDEGEPTTIPRTTRGKATGGFYVPDDPWAKAWKLDWGKEGDILAQGLGTVKKTQGYGLGGTGTWAGIQATSGEEAGDMAMHGESLNARSDKWGIMPSRGPGSYRQDGLRMTYESGPERQVMVDASNTGEEQVSYKPDERSDEHNVQSALAYMGFNIGKNKDGKPLVDGSLGAMSSSSLIIFQYKMGLKVTGVPDSETLSAMNDCIRKGVTYGDIMKMPGRVLWVDDDPENKTNGRLNEGAMTRIPALGGEQGRQHEATAVAWAHMVQAAAKEAPHLNVNRLLINGPRCGYRNLQEQHELYNEYVGKQPVAKPGTSNHGKGAAMDINVGYDPDTESSPAEHQWVADNAARFGFQPLDSETWHWDYRPRRKVTWQDGQMRWVFLSSGCRR